MKPKKILFVINRLATGGAERLVVDDINEFIKRGFDVMLVTLLPEKPDNSIMGECKIDRDNWSCVNVSGIYNPFGIIRFTRLIRRMNPDAILSHLWLANSVVRLSAKLARVERVICFENGVYDTTKSWRAFLLDRMLDGWCTKIVAVSDAVRESLVRNGIDKEKLVTIKNAVDTARFKGYKKVEVRKELGIGLSDFVFIFVGRLIKTKGADVLLKAYEGFGGDDTLMLIIVGDGSERGELQKIVEESGLKNVTLLGNRKDVPKLLASADCFVLPSKNEGFGSVVLEAKSACLPCIVSDFQSSSEIVNNGIDGIIVPRDNWQALFSAMKSVRYDTALRQRLAEGSCASASDFSIERHAKELINLL